MTSLLQPGYTLNLGSQQWTNQLLQLDLTLEAAPLIDVLNVRLPAAAPISADIGGPAELTLDSGEKNEKVFTGQIASIGRSFSDIVVCVVNAGALLARFRPAATYEQITAGKVGRSLCDDGGADTGSIQEGGPAPVYADQPSRTPLGPTARLWGER